VSEPPRSPAGDADLEELGDEVIISQETGAHAPQRRANVTTDHPTVVISEPAPPRRPESTVPYRAVRDRGEKTVIIRDRKKLEKMRRDIARRKQKSRVSRSTVYLIGIAGLASLVAGTLLAALVDASQEEDVSQEEAAAPSAHAGALAAPAVSGSSVVPPGAIDLDALPDPVGPRAEP
jgi:hypothetical protein